MITGFVQCIEWQKPLNFLNVENATKVNVKFGGGAHGERWTRAYKGGSSRAHGPVVRWRSPLKLNAYSHLHSQRSWPFLLKSVCFCKTRYRRTFGGHGPWSTLDPPVSWTRLPFNQSQTTRVCVRPWPDDLDARRRYSEDVLAYRNEVCRPMLSKVRDWTRQPDRHTGDGTRSSDHRIAGSTIWAGLDRVMGHCSETLSQFFYPLSHWR